MRGREGGYSILFSKLPGIFFAKNAILIFQFPNIAMEILQVLWMWAYFECYVKDQ